MTILPTGQWQGRHQRRGKILIALSTTVLAVLLCAAAYAMRLLQVAPSVAAGLLIAALPAIIVLSAHAGRLVGVLMFPKAPERRRRLSHEPLLAIPVILRTDRDIAPLRRSIDANIAYVRRKPVALLIDLADASEPVTSDDAAIMAAVRLEFAGEIEAGHVMPLYRVRRYDPVDSVWRGWERKRGKVEAFCRWLQGSQGTDFVGCLPPDLENVEAIVTIDVDTRMNKQTVAQLSKAVDEDAAIVAPAIEITCGPNATLFERLQTPTLWGRPFDPRPTFNQTRLGHDLFHGKGLIMVDRFVERIGGRVAERTMLSHDLVEASLAGAVSTRSAVVEEAAPASRRQWARRQERWMRGDFQNTRWIISGGLPLTGRFQLLEIAASQLVSLGCVVFVAIALCAVQWPNAGWMALAALLLLQPSLALTPLDLLAILLQDDRPLHMRFREAGVTVGTRAASWLLAFGFALLDARVAAQAAMLAWWRMNFSGRKLLAWDDASTDHADVGHVSPDRPLAVVVGSAALVVGGLSDGAVQAAAVLSLLWAALPFAFELRLCSGSGALDLGPAQAAVAQDAGS